MKKIRLTLWIVACTAASAMEEQAILVKSLHLQASHCFSLGIECTINDVKYTSNKATLTLSPPLFICHSQEQMDLMKKNIPNGLYGYTLPSNKLHIKADLGGDGGGNDTWNHSQELSLGDLLPHVKNNTITLLYRGTYSLGKIILS